VVVVVTAAVAIVAIVSFAIIVPVLIAVVMAVVDSGVAGLPLPSCKTPFPSSLPILHSLTSGFVAIRHERQLAKITDLVVALLLSASKKMQTGRANCRTRSNVKLG
jgi:hypothetical protein